MTLRLSNAGYNIKADVKKGSLGSERTKEWSAHFNLDFGQAQYKNILLSEAALSAQWIS